MRDIIIILFSLLFFNGCYTIINPPMSEPAYSEEIDEFDGLDTSNEYEAIDDSSIIIEGDYVNVYNNAHSCSHSYCNHHNHHSYSYSWWWSDYGCHSYSSNYYDWYHWDHHYYHNNYNYGSNWGSNDYVYTPSKKKRRDHSFGRDTSSSTPSSGSANEQNVLTSRKEKHITRSYSPFSFEDTINGLLSNNSSNKKHNSVSKKNKKTVKKKSRKKHSRKRL